MAVFFPQFPFVQPSGVVTSFGFKNSNEGLSIKLGGEEILGSAALADEMGIGVTMMAMAVKAADAFFKKPRPFIVLGVSLFIIGRN